MESQDTQTTTPMRHRDSISESKYFGFNLKYFRIWSFNKKNFHGKSPHFQTNSRLKKCFLYALVMVSCLSRWFVSSFIFKFRALEIQSSVREAGSDALMSFCTIILIFSFSSGFPYFPRQTEFCFPLSRKAWDFYSSQILCLLLYLRTHGQS